MGISQLGVISLKEFDLNLSKLFTCGERSLDTFLYEQSRSFEENLYSSTWLVIHPEYEVVGYFSLCCSSLQLQSQEAMELNLDKSKYHLRAPGILLTKMAVSSAVQYKGFGKKIINLIKEIAVENANKISARLLIVDAVNGKDNFYERCGFTPCINNSKNQKTKKMYLDLLSLG